MTTTTPSTPTRRLGDVVLPGAGTWDIDPVHADVAFTGRHFMVTRVRGRFTDVTGAVVVAEDMNDSRVDVVIAMASVESGSSVRDDHLRSAEMFDVEQFPEATFRSVGVDWQGTRGVVQGDLTLHGVTRRVPLEVTFEGYVRDPWGGDRAIFSASTRVNREDFGITWNVALEAGGVLVSKEVAIDIQVETVLRTDSNAA
jgi:polyisoprenoid-binding protein YceI